MVKCSNILWDVKCGIRNRNFVDETFLLTSPPGSPIGCRKHLFCAAQFLQVISMKYQPLICLLINVKTLFFLLFQEQYEFPNGILVAKLGRFV